MKKEETPVGEHRGLSGAGAGELSQPGAGEIDFPVAAESPYALFPVRLLGVALIPIWNWCLTLLYQYGSMASGDSLPFREVMIASEVVSLLAIACLARRLGSISRHGSVVATGVSSAVVGIVLILVGMYAPAMLPALVASSVGGPLRVLRWRFSCLCGLRRTLALLRGASCCSASSRCSPPGLVTPSSRRAPLLSNWGAHLSFRWPAGACGACPPDACARRRASLVPTSGFPFRGSPS